MKPLVYAITGLLILTLSGPAFSDESARILALRAGGHETFHRLVIELSHEALYRVETRGGRVKIMLQDVNSRGYRPAPLDSDFFTLERVSTEKKKKGFVTTLVLALDREARIRKMQMDRPFRVIVDMYPRGRAASSRTGRIKRPSLQKAKQVPPQKPRRLSALVFNEGWRRGFEKKAVMGLKAAYYSKLPLPGLDLLREVVPLKGADAWKSGVEARAEIRSLLENGEKGRAETLKVIVALIKEDGRLEDLESIIMRTPENALTPLARFLLAVHYEKEGLYPEAIAYYALAHDSAALKRLRAESALARGRALFFSGRGAEASIWLERAVKDGAGEARPFLAAMYMLRGEIIKARHAYARLGRPKDPLALMGLGRLMMMRRDYSGAGEVYTALAERFRKDDFLWSFFMLRSADALLASGALKDALETYSSLSKNSRGLGRSMAKMALADYYSGDGKNPSTARALYENVASGTGQLAGEARLRLAAVLNTLKRFDEAMRTVDALSPENTPFGAGSTIRFLRSRIAFNWVAFLYTKKKWPEISMLNYRFGDLISLGRRAEYDLMVGEAMLRAGLTPDGVRALKMAENLGTKDVKEKALFLLARLYLDQSDPIAAGRILADIKSLDAKAARGHLWKDYDLETQYLRGGYGDVVRLGRGSRSGEVLLMVGRAYERLGDMSGAARAFRDAAALFKEKNNTRGLVSALTGYGDIRFESREFRPAIEAYTRAASLAGGREADLGNWARYRLALSYAGAGMERKASDLVADLKKRDKSYGAWAEALSKVGAGG